MDYDTEKADEVALALLSRPLYRSHKASFIDGTAPAIELRQEGGAAPYEL